MAEKVPLILNKNTNQFDSFVNRNELYMCKNVSKSYLNAALTVNSEWLFFAIVFDSIKKQETSFMMLL